MEENGKKGGLRLMMKLLLVIAIPLLILCVLAILAIRSVCMDVSDKMVKHELNLAQYSFNVSVNNLAMVLLCLVMVNSIKARKISAIIQIFLIVSVKKLIYR